MVARLSLLLLFLFGCLCTLAWSTTESVCDFSSSVRLGISWGEIANAKLYEIRYKKAGNRCFGVTLLFWFRSIRSLQHLTTSRETFFCCKIETASNYSLGHPYKKAFVGKGARTPTPIIPMLHRWETSSQTTVGRRAVIQDLQPNTAYQFRVRASTANEVLVTTMSFCFRVTLLCLHLCEGEWLAEMV